MLLTDQFLHVELIVHKDDHVEFERLVSAFLKQNGFDRFDKNSDKHLVLALRTPEPIAYSGYRRRQSSAGDPRDEFVTLRNGTDIRSDQKIFYRYIHVWRLGKTNDLDLARLMRLSADDEQYREIDNLVIREKQEIVFRVPWISDLPDLQVTSTLKVARITRQLATRELGTYLFSLGALVPTLESQGFHTIGCFQNITGLLNTITEYWNTNVDDLTPLHRTPEEVSAAVFGNSSEQREITGVHQKVTFSQEFYQAYLGAEHLNIDLVGRRWA